MLNTTLGFKPEKCSDHPQMIQHFGNLDLKILLALKKAGDLVELGDLVFDHRLLLGCRRLLSTQVFGDLFDDRLLKPLLGGLILCCLLGRLL